MRTLLMACAGLLLLGSHPVAHDPPLTVSPCELARQPKTYDRRVVQVRDTLSVSFENSTLVIADCDTSQRVSLSFGGDVPGVVPSTFNDTLRSPGTDVEVDGSSRRSG